MRILHFLMKNLRYELWAVGRFDWNTKRKLTSLHSIFKNADITPRLSGPANLAQIRRLRNRPIG